MTNLVDSIHDNIEKYGLSVIAVQRDPETGTPNFSYSIGLSLSKNHELFSESFPPELAQYLINEIARQLPKHNIGIDHTCTVMGLVQNNMPIALIEVDEEDFSETRTVQVSNMIDVADYSVLQIILPDLSGLFPWEEGHDHSMGKQVVHRKEASDEALKALMSAAPTHVVVPDLDDQTKH